MLVTAYAYPTRHWARSNDASIHSPEVKLIVFVSLPLFSFHLVVGHPLPLCPSTAPYINESTYFI